MTQNYFKYCSADLAILSLEVGRLSWSSPVLFNDPFDNQMNMLLEEDRESMVDDFLSRLEGAVKGEVTLDYNLGTDSQPVQMLQLIKDDYPDQYQNILTSVRASISESLNGIDEKFSTLTGPILRAFALLSILCLSKIKDSLLMWSHYADNHRGVVLEFKASSKESIFNQAKKVIYSKSFAKFNFKEMRDDSNSVIDKYVLTKNIDWNYEEEWRISIPLTDYKVPRELRSFDSNDLAALYLGCRISDSNKTTIVSLRNRFFPHAKIYQAEKSLEGFSLIFKEVS